MTGLINGPPLCEYISISSSKALMRAVANNPALKSSGHPIDQILFMTYPIVESKSVFSSLYLECKEAVDSKFARDSEKVSKIVSSVVIDNCEEFVELSGLFKTIELGCCHAFSHHKFGLKSISCAIFLPDNVQEQIHSLFTV